MEMHAVSWLAIVAAVVAAFVVGALWYSPALFIRPWAEMSGVDGEKFNAGMPRALIVDGISFIVMAWALDQVQQAWGAETLIQGILVCLLVWVGFVATTLLHSVTYEQRPLAFYAINAGYRLVSIMVMGVVLTLLR